MESIFANSSAVTTSGMVGAIAALTVTVLILLFILVIGLYIYQALAWQSIARKLKYPRPWLAWIPFANLSMLLQLGNFHWAWVFLIFTLVIPVVGIFGIITFAVLMILAHWKIYEKLGYPGWLAILSLINVAYMIIIGIVAWEKKKPKKAKRR